MANQFYKGRTNNHLTWVMVDATDFATPESAVSAATAIKIYGKVRGATGVNFVSSGAGSLTNDIQHVGASATGIYTIALAKADLSDASNAWYDQYIVTLSATGCARQTLIVDGGINESAISGFQSRLSDIASAITVVQSMASDAASAAVQANSRVLLNQSRISDIQSYLVVMLAIQSDIYSALLAGVPLDASTISDIRSAIAATELDASDLSDIASAVWANTIGTRVDSRILLNQSRISDIQSVLAAGVPLDASTISDIRSAIAATELDASDLSDIASAVWANAIGTRVDSRILLNQSRISDIQSVLAAGVPLDASTMSDLRSAIAGVTATVSASDISDIASAVWANAIGARVDSRVLLNLSRISDVQSALAAGVPLDASTLSDIRSAITAQTATVSASDISDIASAVWANTIGARVDSRILLNQSRISDIQSVLAAGVPLDASTLSDLRSAINAGPAATVTASDISDIASAVWAFSTRSVSLVASTMSDIRSAIAAGPAATVTASDISDIASAVWANAIGARVDSRVLLTQSRVSDVQSALAAGVALDASTLSDIRSAITAQTATVSASDISDIASAVWANTIGARVDSRLLLTQSRVSDIQSALAAGVPLDASTLSDLRSAIAATELDASDLSDIASAVWANSIGARVDSRVLLTQSLASDAHSAATLGASRALVVQSRLSDLDSRLVSDVSDLASAVAATKTSADAAASRALLNQSRVSDIYSLLSDLHSDVGVVSGVLSDAYSLMQAGVEVGPSSLSDLRSAITANGILVAGAEPTTIFGHTDTLKAKIDWLAALSRNKITQTATLQSLRNDADNSTIASAVVSDDGTTFTRAEWGS